MIGVRVRDDDLFHVAEAETAGGQHSRQLVDRARLQGAGVNDSDRRVDQQVAIDAPALHETASADSHGLRPQIAA
jgi:hypothetical protein